MKVTSKNVKVLEQFISRAILARSLGKSYGEDRDIYTALGYPKVITFEDCYARFRRQGIARKVVTAYPEACWNGKIRVVGEKKRGVAAVWASMETALKATSRLKQADILSGIGSFGILVVGLADGRKLDEPAGKASKVIYLKPFSQRTVTISSTDLETDVTSPRFGMPNFYGITIDPQVSGGGITRKVHWTRVVHIAEDKEESEIYGTSRLEPVFNNLMNLELVCGGSAEMFWRGAFPGISLEADAEAEFTPDQKKAMNDELTNYVHRFQRFLRLQGVKANQLMPTAVDPQNHVAVQVDQIAGSRGIPKRILMGSERGELSSAQDEQNWMVRVMERRWNFCEPDILRPVISVMEKAQIVQPEEIEVIWPDLMNMDALSKAKIAEIKMRCLYNYSRSPGGFMMFPLTRFMTDVLGYTEAELKEMKYDEKEVETFLENLTKGVDSQNAKVDGAQRVSMSG